MMKSKPFWIGFLLAYALAIGGADGVPVLSTASDAASDVVLGPYDWALLCKVDGNRTIADLAGATVKRLECRQRRVDPLDRGMDLDEPRPGGPRNRRAPPRVAGAHERDQVALHHFEIVELLVEMPRQQQHVRQRDVAQRVGAGSADRAGHVGHAVVHHVVHQHHRLTGERPRRGKGGALASDARANGYALSEGVGDGTTILTDKDYAAWDQAVWTKYGWTKFRWTEYQWAKFRWTILIEGQ